MRASRSDVVDDRRARRHRRLGIEHGGKHLVVDDEAPAAFLRRGLAVGDHRGDALAGKADDVVEDDRVVGIVGRRARGAPWRSGVTACPSR